MHSAQGARNPSLSRCRYRLSLTLANYPVTPAAGAALIASSAEAKVVVQSQFSTGGIGKSTGKAVRREQKINQSKRALSEQCTASASRDKREGSESCAVLRVADLGRFSHRLRRSLISFDGCTARSLCPPS